MDSLHRMLVSDAFNSSDICSSECVPSDDNDYCSSGCIKFCLLICPNRLPPISTSFSHHSVFPKKFLVAAIVLGLTVISLICLTVYYKFYSGPCIRQRRRRRGGGGEEPGNQINEEFIDEDQGPVLDHPTWYINTVGLHASVINSIAVCKYKKGDGFVEGTDCSVCLSEFEEDETLRLLPKCSHAFHIPCIDTWLRSHTNCPLCRAPIVAPNPKPEGGETQIGGAENREENGEIRDVEMEIETQEGDSEDRKRTEEHEGIQALRRSISVDCLSGFSISQGLACVQRDDLVQENESRGEIASKRVGLSRLMASSSVRGSLQIGPSLLKRSISCGGKLFLQRYSRNSSSSVLPL